jgi:hypothetical protein
MSWVLDDVKFIWRVFRLHRYSIHPPKVCSPCPPSTGEQTANEHQRVLRIGSVHYLSGLVKSISLTPISFDGALNYGHEDN